MKSTFFTLLVTATAAYAQFALKIVQPLDQEFLQLGGTFPLEIQAPVSRLAYILTPPS
jgi:hypothetical protein